MSILFKVIVGIVAISFVIVFVMVSLVAGIVAMAREIFKPQPCC